MRKSRYSEEPIIRVLRQVESGQKVKDVIREHGISEQTYLSVEVEVRRHGGV
jgi:putative transposase